MSYSAIVVYNKVTPTELQIIQQLKIYLSQRNIDVVMIDNNLPEPHMQTQLSTAQWLVLILTPETIRSSKVQILVDSAFEYVKQGAMQGVLALTFSPDLEELEDLPHPWWVTMRIYYMGQTREERQQAFEKLSRTLGYLRVPAQTASTPVGNRNKTSSIIYGYSTASRTLPVIPQRVQNSQSRLVKSTLVIFALIVILLAGYKGVSSFFAGSPKAHTSPVNLSANNGKPTNANTQANATATAQAQQSLANKQILKDDTKNTPSFSMNAQDQAQGWAYKDPCLFTQVGYQITNTAPGQDTLCMASKTDLMNFAYQAQMTFQSGDGGGGLIFRSNGLNSFYRFSLDANGKYALIECQQTSCPNSPADENNPLVNPTLLQGAINADSLVKKHIELTVIATAQAIYLFISSNGQLVDTKTGSFTIKQGGEIGLFAFSQSQSTTVVFSNVKVWKLP